MLILSKQDTQSVVELGSYNKPGGLYKAELIDRKLIDVFVPFLPLENWHVQQCARYQFVERGYYPTKKTVSSPELRLSRLTT